MRLEAVELEAVATFSAPVVIPDIAPGLNVLAGPNERGKSTLLRALLTVFLEGHRSRKQTLETLRPYAGGAPRIACRFALASSQWRIEKQYLSAARAELVRGAGEARHIGADAETALARLLAEAGNLAARLPMFWVNQTETARLPLLDDGLRHSLGEVLAAEAEKSSGASSANAALDEVRRRLDEHITSSRGQPRRGGAYARRLAEREEVRAALAAAEARARQAEAWTAQLTDLQQRESELADEAVATRDRTRREGLERRLAEAAQAARQVKQLTERLTFLTEQRKQRAATLAAHDDAVAERRALEAAMAAAESELARIVTEAADLDAGIDNAALALADCQAREAQARKVLDAARGRSIRIARGARRDQLEAQLTRLHTIGAEIAALDETLAAMDWPEATFAAVEEATRRIEALEMRRAAAAPALKVHYDEGRDTGFRIADEDLADGEERRLVRAVTVDVAGIGRLEVRPALTEARDKLDAELDHWRHRLARHLATIGAATPEEAEQREAVRRDRRQRRRLMIVERDTIAPEGAARIEAELAELTDDDDGADAGADRDAALAPREAEADAEAALAKISAERDRLAADLDRLREERARRENRRTELATASVMRRTRLGELASLLGGEQEADPREELSANVDDADRQISEARRERQAFEEIALAPDKMVALEAEIDELKRVEAGRGERLIAVRQDMRRIEGQLVRDFEEGPGEAASALASRLEALETEIADVEIEIDALKLLAGELEAETERHRREISGPLAARLEKLAAGLWPDAEIALTPGLEVANLARNGAREAPAAVSVGTHEQLAVLARIAYADMLAAGGATVPIILDDPFVYSDDARLDKLFDVIAEAATRHQIIILTCHARAFEPLITHHGARRLDFERPDAANVSAPPASA